MVETIEETARWKGRSVTYKRGQWRDVAKCIPSFNLDPFSMSPKAPANPYLRSVVRQPIDERDSYIPVGVVSYSYKLVQHAEIVDRCLSGVRGCDIDLDGLMCEVGLTTYGEWMNLRVYFPPKYDFKAADGKQVKLRLECFNSVDGSSRLIILLGWYRLVCSNGMIIGDTKVEFKNVHNQNLDLDGIPGLIVEGINLVEEDKERLEVLEKTSIDHEKYKTWINKILAKSWGVKAAARVHNICQHGHDVTFPKPFAGGEASEKTVEKAEEVPGAQYPAENLYQVSQALSWIASRRANTDERLRWQGEIPVLLKKYAEVA